MWVLGVGWYLELDDLVLQTFSAKIGAKLDVLPFFFSQAMWFARS